jgi:hypothetical protein
LLIAAMAGGMFPFFEYWRFVLPALAYVELTALFRSKSGRASEDSDEVSRSTAEDYEEFILYMRGNDRPFAKAGYTIRDEFNCWLAHRSRNPQVMQRPAA